jgi:addiction module RelB/DinJ family antitoxin
VEPQVKKKAEAILASLGISPSSAINALYHQIIYTNGLPFSITLPSNVPVMEDMSEEDFNNMMKESLERADKGDGRPSKVVFNDIRKKIY